MVSGNVVIVCTLFGVLLFVVIVLSLCCHFDKWLVLWLDHPTKSVQRGRNYRSRKNNRAVIVRARGRDLSLAPEAQAPDAPEAAVGAPKPDAQAKKGGKNGSNKGADENV